MRRLAGLLAALSLSVLLNLSAQEVISARDAAQYAGKTVTVRGVVASTAYAASSNGKPTFLNLEKPYPDQGFTVVIWGTDRPKFPEPPERAFRSKTILVTGKVELHRGVPEIVVRNPSQIVVETGREGVPDGR